MIGTVLLIISCGLLMYSNNIKMSQQRRLFDKSRVKYHDGDNT